MRRLILLTVYIMATIALLCLAIMFVCNRVVVHNSKGKCYDDVEQIPTRTVGVLLGTTPQTRVRGRKNQFFKYRIEAAEDLYKKGKVHCLLISGDENSLNGVNEPQCMKDTLVAHGIPAESIHLDGKGFRTINSIVRTRKVFGVRSFTIISQRFHNERALYLAEHSGLDVEDVQAFNARNPSLTAALKTYLHEYLARVKMMIDLAGEDPSSNKQFVPELSEPDKCTVSSATETDEDSEEYDYHDQMELNGLYHQWRINNEQKVESEFQQLLLALPDYKDLFDQEKAIWERYQYAVGAVSRYENHGSSTSMYVDDVYSQGTELRRESFHDLLLKTQGKETLFCNTTYTPAMIGVAYAGFRDAEPLFGDCPPTKLESYQESIRREQRCWNEWMDCRKENAENLPTEIRSIYDRCTNKMMRTKLRQLKNQNQALGMTGYEPVGCVLPEDCSDKTLLEYPGFDQIWARHHKDTNWYPTFE